MLFVKAVGQWLKVTIHCCFPKPVSRPGPSSNTEVAATPCCTEEHIMHAAETPHPAWIGIEEGGLEPKSLCLKNGPNQYFLLEISIWAP